MMRISTLRDYRRVVNKMSHYPTKEMERQLLDSHIEALTKIELLEADLKRRREEK